MLVLDFGMCGICDSIPTEMADTNVTMPAIWFGFQEVWIVSVWVSDRGSHVKNKVMSKFYEASAHKTSSRNGILPVVKCVVRST